MCCGPACGGCLQGSRPAASKPLLPALPWTLKSRPHRPRYLDEALARQFTTAVRVGKKSKEAGKSIKEVKLQILKRGRQEREARLHLLSVTNRQGAAEDRVLFQPAASLTRNSSGLSKLSHC